MRALLLIATLFSFGLAAQQTYDLTLQGSFQTLNSYSRSCLSADDQQVLAGDVTVNGDQQLCLIKFDSDGYVKWSYTYGGSGVERPTSICLASDGGFIIAGTTTSYNSSNVEDLYVLKTDSVGTVQWTKVFADGSQFSPRSVAQTTNGNICVVGCYNVWTYSGQPHASIVLVLDNAGTLVSFQKMNFSRNYPLFMSVKPTLAGGFIMAGSTGHVWDYYGCMAVQTDASGTVQWMTNLRGVTPSGNFNLWTAGDRTSSNVWSVTQLPSGNYLFGGYISDHDQYGTSATFMDGLTFVLDVNGNLLSTTQYPNGVSSVFFDMVTTSSGQVAGTGYAQNGAAGFSYILQPNGALVASHNYSGGTAQQCYSIDQTSTGELVMSGISNRNGPMTYWALKTDPQGADTCASVVVPITTSSPVLNPVILTYTTITAITPSVQTWVKTCFCVPVDFRCAPPEPPVDFSATTACANTPVQFTNLSHFYTYCPPTFLWDFGDGNTSSATNPVHAYGDTGTYVVTLYVIDCSNDTVSNSHPVHIGTGIDVDLGPDTLICGSATLLLDAGFPGSSYAWSTGQSSQTISVSASGVYTVQVTAAACSDVDSIQVTMLAPPNLGGLISNCSGNDVILDAGPSWNTYTWNTGDSTQTISTSLEGAYWVTVSSGACTATDTVEIRGGIGEGSLYFPNAFTPNKDGLNDVFTGVGNNITTFHLDIWNRWGERIYTTDDMNVGWDGYYKGRLVQNDIYVYVVTYTTECTGNAPLRRIGRVWAGN